MQSEKRIWVDQQNPEPTETKCRNYHRDYLNPHEIGRYRQNAEIILNDFANGVVNTTREEFLAQALRQYRTSARVGHRGFRCWGIIEAIIGAFVWAILLVLIYIIVGVLGIDIVEVLRKAVAHSKN
jgi:hypothetical protein